MIRAGLSELEPKLPFWTTLFLFVVNQLLHRNRLDRDKYVKNPQCRPIFVEKAIDFGVFRLWLVSLELLNQSMTIFNSTVKL